MKRIISIIKQKLLLAINICFFSLKVYLSQKAEGTDESGFYLSFHKHCPSMECAPRLRFSLESPTPLAGGIGILVWYKGHSSSSGRDPRGCPCTEYRFGIDQNKSNQTESLFTVPPHFVFEYSPHVWGLSWWTQSVSSRKQQWNNWAIELSIISYRAAVHQAELQTQPSLLEEHLL